MTKRHPGRLAALLAPLLLGAAGAVAQQPAAPAVYQVEVVVFRPGGGAPAAVPGPGVLPGSPAPLAATDLRLGAVARRLAATGYVPLLHAAWRQPAAARIQAWNANAANAPASVGALLYQQGGLVLEIDATVAGLGPADPAGTPGVVRIRETRRIRNGNLHYFDHPDFGVIASVRPVSAGAAATSE
jgi:hypothetical protein